MTSGAGHDAMMLRLACRPACCSSVSGRHQPSSRRERCREDDVAAALDAGRRFIERARDRKSWLTRLSAAAASSPGWPHQGGHRDGRKDASWNWSRPRAARAGNRCRGMLVCPGSSKSHVHFNEPGRTEWEGAETGSLRGGRRRHAFFDMPLNSTPCTVPRRVRCASAPRSKRSVADFGLWGGLVPGICHEMAAMASAVVGSRRSCAILALPNFPRADDDTLSGSAKRRDSACRWPARRERGDHAPLARASPPRSRGIPRIPPDRGESKRSRAVDLARETGCRLHIVHISSGSGVAAARSPRGRCGHHPRNLSTLSVFLRGGSGTHRRPQSALRRCATPRNTLLWGDLLDGRVDIIGSDHSPCPPGMKENPDFSGSGAASRACSPHWPCCSSGVSMADDLDSSTSLGLIAASPGGTVSHSVEGHPGNRK